MIFSYTLVDTFHNVCPRQAHERFIAKSVPVVETPEMQPGKRVHRYIEEHIKGIDPLPAWLGHIADDLERLKAYGSEALKTELRIGVNRELQAVPFFDAGVYLRGAIDLILVGPDAALIIDWKTGKKKDKELQLMIYALFIFALLPVSKITAMNYYVTFPDPMGKAFTWERSELSSMWREVLPLLHEIEQAEFDGKWPERPGPLCGWCPVEKCQHWRPRRG